MRLAHSNACSAVHRHAQRAYAFTLPELMVTMSIFGLAIAAMLSSHLFGLRQDQLVRGKLGVSDQSRLAFNRLVQEIQSAKLVHVGNLSGTTFTPIPDGQPLQGTAIEIHPTTDTNNFIRYFFNTDEGQLWRAESSGSGSDLVADNLTDNLYFRRENHLGEVLTDYEHNHAIAIFMEFKQFEYPLTQVGYGHHYDYYKMEFRVTRRAQD